MVTYGMTDPFTKAEKGVWVIFGVYTTENIFKKLNMNLKMYGFRNTLNESVILWN